MDMYTFLRANGPLLVVIGILVSIIAIIIVVSRYLQASPSSRKVIIIAIVIPFVLLSVSTFVAWNIWNTPQSMDRNATPSKPSPPASPQPAVANAVYASPGDDLQKKASSLSAGQTLILRDGFYANQGLVVEDVHGTATAPITIMAEHDGKAIIDGGTSGGDTVWIENSSYITVQGIVAQHGVQPVVVYGPADHIIIRRVTAHDAAPSNNHVFEIGFGASNVLIEDCAGWGRGRYIFIAYHATNVTFRRDWAYWEDQEQFNAPRAAFSAYGSANITFENVIGTAVFPRRHDPGDNSYTAVYETSNGPATDNVKYLGDIFYNNWDGLYLNAASGQNTQIINSYFESPYMPAQTGFTGKTGGNGIEWWNPYAGSITHSTFVNNKVGISLPNGSARTTNNVFVNNGKAIDNDRGHSYLNFFDNGNSGVSLNPTDKQVDPGYDVAKYGRGAYFFIPTNSPLKRAGQGGSDIGANIIYRYVDGVLTDQPLWPWPMEGRIKAETGISVTWESDGGFWKTLDGVYPNATLFAPSTSCLLTSPLLSTLFAIIREGYIIRNQHASRKLP
jgi:Chondroitinase B